MDDEVRVGRRVWVRHGHVNVIRPVVHENRAGSAQVRLDGEEIRRDGRSGIQCPRNKAERQT